MSYNSLLISSCKVQTKTITHDSDTNQQIESWADTATLACRFSDLSGSEKIVDNIKFKDATHKCYILYRNILSETQRIVFNSENYRILGAWNMGGNPNRYTCIWLEINRQ